MIYLVFLSKFLCCNEEKQLGEVSLEVEINLPIHYDLVMYFFGIPYSFYIAKRFELYLSIPSSHESFHFFIASGSRKSSLS